MGKEREEDSFVELPRRLSDLINNQVKEFVEDQDQGLQADYRYQNANLWFIFKDSLSLLANNGLALVRTRVVLGAFKGEEDFNPDLVFMPDKMVTTPDGKRFIPPPKVRRKMQIVLRLSEYKPEDPGQFLSSVKASLLQAWERAGNIPVGQVNNLIG